MSDSLFQPLTELAAQLRRLNHTTIHFAGSADELQTLTQQAGELAERLEALQGERATPHFQPNFGDDLNRIINHSPFTGRINPLAPPVEMRLEGDRLFGEATLAAGFEGPPNSVHGGIISGIYDQLLAVIGATQNLGGPTAYLTVEYLKPTPLNTPLTFEVWIEKVDGRKVLAKGECHANGQLVTSAEALFIALPIG